MRQQAAAAALPSSSIRGQNGTAPTISNNFLTQLSMGTTSFHGDFFGTGTLNGLNTILTQRAGNVVAALWISWPSFAGERFVRIQVNGASTYWESKGDTDANGSVTTVAAAIYLGAPQFIVAYAYQKSGGNQTLAADFTFDLISYD